MSKKNTQNLDQKFNQRQNTVCLEQQIYASLENFTPTLLVMLETFRRSVPGHLLRSLNKMNHILPLPYRNMQKYIQTTGPFKQ